jgi:deoxyribodipyrimidine photo-lyase
VKRFHDRLIVPPGAVATQAGTPFSVYTPFRNASEAQPLSAPHPAVTRFAAHSLPSPALASLAQLGFDDPATARWPAGETAAAARLADFTRGGAGSALGRYSTGRDVPSVIATSSLSADLKFGTIGIRRVVATVQAAAVSDPGLRECAGKFVSELRWRDFFAHVLWHWPHVERGAFRPMYDDIAWRDDETRFDAWAEGRTGYPIVDAGMRELLATGFMHNRVRMIVASFLTKDLMISWQRGERHFMRHLIDGDLAANNGGWQWAAGTGTDAAPYFRIFNPTSQSVRFDPDGAYVKRWVPELAALPPKLLHAPAEAPPLLLAEAAVTLGETYPHPIVDHAAQRVACLAMYKKVRPDAG